MFGNGEIAVKASNLPEGQKLLAEKPAFFRTLDGFSAAMFYNPYCHAEYEVSLSTVCFNAVYDMNGKKGPNMAGQDIGFTGSFYPGLKASSAAVLPAHNNTSGTSSWNEASERCKKLGGGNTYDLPSLNEVSLIYLNDLLVDASDTLGGVWSRSAKSDCLTKFYILDFGSWLPGGRFCAGVNDSRSVRCVRADNLM